MKIKDKLVKIICILLIFCQLFSSCGNSSDKQKVVDYILENGDEEHYVLLRQSFDGNMPIKLGYIDDKFVITFLTTYKDYEIKSVYTKISFKYNDKKLLGEFIIKDNNDISLINLNGKINTYKHQYYGIDENSINNIELDSNYSTLDDALHYFSSELIMMLYELEVFLEYHSLPYIY